ncbi:tetratricopeptide repeat protein [Pseudoduganella sp. FT26W]|uniref:Tetratricopeptide repeat protein n=2 Tax=Duganella aquatilis TaxID=2666082 RepID=A0A844CYM2_9BURK|nr:tetratricopeptide repeat protein [Duganella aquatilis]
MLQDLDARGGAAAAGEQPEVKAVPAVERDRRPLVIGGAALGVVLLAAGGWFGWQYWTSHSTPPGPVPKVVDNRIPDRPRFQEPPTAIKPIAAPSHANAPVAAETAVSPGVAAPAMPLHATAPAEDADTAPVASRAPAKPKRAAHVAEGEGGETSAAAAPARKPARAPAAPADGIVLRELTPKQMSENSYRRALAALQEGRVSAAMADLDKAVEIDPRNDAARQTYVSLLLENRRTDDAIRQLRLALGVDARQPGLAMVLARLQLEKGGPALDTLLKTLPYATNNADYQAFLAGVLQRDQRHAEAAEHYREALGLAPGNAVWWMGLGISLQADQHLPEAREAYKQARASAGLTPELKSFVDKKIEQLSR